MKKKVYGSPEAHITAFSVNEVLASSVEEQFQQDFYGAGFGG